MPLDDEADESPDDKLTRGNEPFADEYGKQADRVGRLDAGNGGMATVSADDDLKRLAGCWGIVS